MQIPIAGSTDEAQRAQAARADGHGVFAGVGWYRGESASYFKELARRRIVAINDTGDFETSHDQQTSAPYLWTYRPPLDQALANAAAFVCTSLSRRPARFAGAPYTVQTRKFAIGVDGSPPTPDYSALRDGLRRCGVEPFVIDMPDVGDSIEPYEEYRTLVAQLRAENVTSIMCVCEEYQWYNLAFEADQQNYLPEYIATGMPEVSDRNRSPSPLWPGPASAGSGSRASGKRSPCRTCRG